MRIDKELTEKYGSRTKAARAVERGEVLVNGKIVPASYDLKPTDIMTFGMSGSRYVSMGGYKLQKALDEFEIDPEGLIYADIGASTGGFTDCLLQRGAKKVYCVDVGKNQLDSLLLGDKTVVIDNFNARDLTPDLFDDTLDGIVADVSFISLTYIMEGVAASLGDGKIFIGLIKPQFEL
ncbi:MAG: TlyA family RNA methyltransferase, partial [Clostridia bacterium]|nr:TlyA family RNA methyltransferase [Clostridia bacterium]